MQTTPPRGRWQDPGSLSAGESRPRPLSPASLRDLREGRLTQDRPRPPPRPAPAALSTSEAPNAAPAPAPPREQARKRPRDEAPSAGVASSVAAGGQRSGHGDASTGRGHRDVSEGQVKEAACKAVKELLRPRYAAKHISKEQFKAVARAATRALMASQAWATTGTGGAPGVSFHPDAVRLAVEACLASGSSGG